MSGSRAVRGDAATSGPRFGARRIGGNMPHRFGAGGRPGDSDAAGDDAAGDRVAGDRATVASAGIDGDGTAAGTAAGAGGGGGIGGRPSVAGPDDGGYPLAGLLFCRLCQLPLSPMEMLGGRAYRSPCGCRLTVVAAEVLERLVYDAVAAREPAALTGPYADDPAELFRRFLAEVRVGADLDDLSLVWLT